MMQKLFTDMIAARKGDNAVAKSLLVTLYSEAARVGKDRRNGDTTDEEVIAVVKKFAANAEETRRPRSASSYGQRRKRYFGRTVYVVYGQCWRRRLVRD